ncbi:hypothetical protein D3C87_1606280 [compost metagenome]
MAQGGGGREGGGVQEGAVGGGRQFRLPGYPYGHDGKIRETTVNLEFEEATRLRDEINKIELELTQEMLDKN